MKTKIKQEYEYNEQKLFCTWFKGKGKMPTLTNKEGIEMFNGLEKGYILFSVPNEGARHNGNKFKDTGLLAGMNDLIILCPDKSVIFLEMKRKDGSVSHKQGKIHKQLKAIGHTVLVGFGFFDAKKKIEEVLNVSK